jgi:4-diphosphocytidyl-2-C-methyl-D-erythritol kinase
MEKIQLKARAKINLSLDVIGKRPDGYHEVEMIMQQIDLFDIVTIEEIEGTDIIITSQCPFIPQD